MRLMRARSYPHARRGGQGVRVRTTIKSRSRQDLFLRSRISANTFHAGSPVSPTDFATSGTSARRNGFAAFSAPMVDGMVGSLAARSFSTSVSRAQRGIVGFDRFGEGDIGLGIFVAAIDARVVRQRAQLEQRLPHHLRRALDDPPAADRE